MITIANEREERDEADDGAIDTNGTVTENGDVITTDNSGETKLKTALNDLVPTHEERKRKAQLFGSEQHGEPHRKIIHRPYDIIRGGVRGDELNAETFNKSPIMRAYLPYSPTKYGEDIEYGERYSEPPLHPLVSSVIGAVTPKQRNNAKTILTHLANFNNHSPGTFKVNPRHVYRDTFKTSTTFEYP